MHRYTCTRIEAFEVNRLAFPLLRESQQTLASELSANAIKAISGSSAREQSQHLRHDTRHPFVLWGRQIHGNITAFRGLIRVQSAQCCTSPQERACNCRAG